MKLIRLKFKKYGLAVYISHLDVNRCITRAVRRAGIPIWYTEGFNPHPYATFLLPLPLGQSGENELLDMKLAEDISFEEIKRRLNATLPDGLKITDVYEPRRGANGIAAAEYEAEAIFENEKDAEIFARKATGIYEGGVLYAEKTSKKGIKTVNLCDMIRSFGAKSSGNRVKISTVLAAGGVANLNCELLTGSLFSACSVEPIKTEITRLRPLDANLETFE